MSPSSFIWSAAGLLRCECKQSEYGKVVLSFTVLRRMDCVLEEAKVGFEMPFDRHFYAFRPPRSPDESDAELKIVTDRILTMIGGLSA
jgi:hypothetical protein